MNDVKNEKIKICFLLMFLIVVSFECSSSKSTSTEINKLSNKYQRNGLRLRTKNQQISSVHIKIKLNINRLEL